MSEYKAISDSQTRMSYRIALILILCLGVALRLYNLHNSSLWLDEVHSVRRASQQNWSVVYEMWRISGHGPLYEWVLLHNWLRLGSGEFFLRFPTVVIGVVNIALIFVVGKRFFRGKIGLIASLVFALAPLHIYYSRESRPYVLDTLFTTLSLLFFHRLAFQKISERVWPARIGYLFSATLALYTHYTTVFFLASLAMWGSVYAFIKLDWKFLRDIFVLHLLALLLFSPWLSMFRTQVTQQPFAWIPDHTWVEILSIVLGSFWYPLVIGWTVTSLLCIILLLGFVLIVISWRSRNLAGETQGKLMLLGVCFLGPVLLGGMVSIFWHSFIVDRYFLYIVAPASLLAGWVLFYLCKEPIGKFITSLLIVGVLVSAFGLVRISWKEDWRGVTDKIVMDSTSDEVVVLLSRQFLLPFDYYYTGEGLVSVLASASDVEQLVEATRNHEQLWVVRAERFPADENVWQAFINTVPYTLVHCETFGDYYDLKLCLYE